MAKRNPTMQSRERHGMSNSPEFTAWAHMRSRCKNSNSQYYFRYGGRGVKVCKEWDKSFSSFLADMGKRPSIWHSLERINLDGDYEPSNCKWALKKEQMRNTSRNSQITIGGVTRLLCEWVEISGINPTTLRGRIRARWPDDKILDKKRFQKINLNRKTFPCNGENLSIKEMSEKYGVPIKTLYCRIRRGMPIERAVTQPRKNYPGSW